MGFRALNQSFPFYVVLDSSSNVVVRYVYDAWGNCKVLDANGKELTSATHIGNLNPFRYRGYYYDTETKLYYLQTRYYDPATGRFINADSVMGINADMSTYNLFAYCGNNPVNRYDTVGASWSSFKNRLKKLGSTLAGAAKQITKTLAPIVAKTAIVKIGRMLQKYAKPLITSMLHIGNELAVVAGFDTAAIGAYFLYMEKDKDGIYHVDTDNCWQWIAGYNDLYDFFFDLGTDMKPAPFKFKDEKGNEEYALWGWKGNYINLGAGAELGLYYGGDPQWFVSHDLHMPMAMSVWYKGTEIMKYADDTWWLTAFNPAREYLHCKAADLSVAYRVEFKFDTKPNAQFKFDTIYDAFKDKWGNDWQCNDDHTATYTFI